MELVHRDSRRDGKRTLDRRSAENGACGALPAARPALSRPGAHQGAARPGRRVSGPISPTRKPSRRRSGSTMRSTTAAAATTRQEALPSPRRSCRPAPHAERLTRIVAMIEATATHALPDLGDEAATRDAAFFLDMDLSILGAPQARLRFLRSGRQARIRLGRRQGLAVGPRGGAQEIPRPSQDLPHGSLPAATSRPRREKTSRARSPPSPARTHDARSL